MFLSVFDIFKIGIGPSSSHTMGPMTAAARFLDDLRGGADKIPGAGRLSRLGASLHGSLAFTGKGHATDRAVVLGLLGFRPDTLDPDAAEALEATVRKTGRITPPGLGDLAFDPDKDLIFDYGPALAGHANGLILKAFDERGNPYLTQTYYSVGGGFVVTAEELAASQAGDLHAEKAAMGYPHPFGKAAEMLAMGQATGLTIAQMKHANETTHSGPGLAARLDTLWAAMNACIERGLRPSRRACPSPLH